MKVAICSANGHIDLTTSHFKPIYFLPGFACGISFISDSALIGLSLPRENRTFDDLALDEKLTGEGVVQELYSVADLPNVIRPMALGFRSVEIRFMARPDEMT